MFSALTSGTKCSRVWIALLGGSVARLPFAIFASWTDSAQNIHMHIEQSIIVLTLLGGSLFGLAAFFSRARRIHLAVSAVVLLLLSSYEIRMDRWEKTVTAPIRLDMFLEIPLMILCLIFGVWQLVLCRKKKALY